MYFSPITELFCDSGDVFWLRVVITAAPFCAGAAVAAIGYKTGRLSKHAALSGVFLWTYTLFILFVTIIGRNAAQTYHIRTEWFASYREYAETGNPDNLRDIVINLMMFIPFAYLFARFVDGVSGEKSNFVKPAAVTLIAGISFTLTIECVQLATCLGTFDVDDLFHNTIGTLLGVTLWILWKGVVSKNSHGRPD